MGALPFTVAVRQSPPADNAGGPRHRGVKNGKEEEQGWSRRRWRRKRDSIDQEPRQRLRELWGDEAPGAKGRRVYQVLRKLRQISRLFYFPAWFRRLFALYTVLYVSFL